MMNRTTNPASRLTDHQLHMARALWLALAALILVLFSIGQWFLYTELQQPCVAVNCSDLQQLTPQQIAQLQSSGLTIGFYAAYQVGWYGVLFLVFGGVAALLFWQKAEERMALFVAFTLLLAAGGFLGVSTTLQAAAPIYWLLMEGLGLLSGSSMFLFFFLFPNGHFVPRWTRWLALFQAPYHFTPETVRDFLLYQTVQDVILALFVFWAIVAQVYRYYRVSTLTERRQTRWVFFGTLVGLGGILPLILYVDFIDPTWLHHPLKIMVFIGLIYTGFLAIPVSIGMAILRSRLYDIDLIIRHTLVYSMLTGLLALLYFGSVVLFQQLVRPFVGQGETPLVTVASTLAIASLFTPLRRRVQNGIDRRFYRRKYNAEQVLARFGETVRNETVLDKLNQRLIVVVQEAMQPTRVPLWLKPEGDGKL